MVALSLWPQPAGKTETEVAALGKGGEEEEEEQEEEQEEEREGGICCEFPDSANVRNQGANIPLTSKEQRRTLAGTEANVRGNITLTTHLAFCSRSCAE